MIFEHDQPGTTAIVNDSGDFEVTSRQPEAGPTIAQPTNSVYRSDGDSVSPVEHYHPGSALCYSVPMAAREDPLTAPLTADIGEVTARIESVARTLRDWLTQDAPESVQDTVRQWGDTHNIEDPYLIAPRYAALRVLLKTVLYETYVHRTNLPILNGGVRDALSTAACKTGNRAFEESPLDTLVWHCPGDVEAELCWWRCALITTVAPADDLSTLFEALVPASERGHHGQYYTPSRISDIMRELAARDHETILDTGIGAGALSVSRDQSPSIQTYGVEQSHLGFLMAVTALALTDQSGVIHETDFFDIAPATLGMDPDAAIRMGRDTGNIDIVPGDVDAIIGNPPYIANRNLDRESTHYRQHLHAFGSAGQSPYLDGDKRISGRSDLFVYFTTHATQFLTEGGRLVYLLPAKWMETQYGETLQTFLFDHYQVSAIIEFEDSVFNDVQVDAVILVANRCTDATTRNTTATRFITVTGEMDPASITELVEDSAVGTPASDDTTGITTRAEPDFRITTVQQSRLADHDDSDGPLTQYFQVPAPLQSLKQNEMLVSLDTLATVTYGHKTGNNDFFLLTAADLNTWPIAEHFYRAAIDDFGSSTGYHLTARDTNTYMLDVHSYVTSHSEHCDDVSSQSRPQQVQTALARDGHDALLAYIENADASPTEESAPSDDVWFDVGSVDAPELVHPYRVYKQVRVAENTGEVIPTNCANGIDVDADVDPRVLLGYLNSTVHAAFLELWCQSEGGGSLEVTTRSLQQVPAVDVRVLTDADKNAIRTAFNAHTQGEDDAQTRLDEAVLTAINAEIDAGALQEMAGSLRNDRLTNK